MPKSYHITALTKKHFKEVELLSNKTLGNDYLKNEIYSSPKPKNQIFRIAIDDQNNLLGFSLSYYLSYDQFMEFTGIAPKHIAFTNQKIGFLKSEAVDTPFRKKGIGHDLMDDAICLMKNHGVTQVYGTAWHGKGYNTSKTILERYGFIKKAILPMFWHKESLEKIYDCPVCGKPPCMCNALLYKLLIPFQ